MPAAGTVAELAVVVSADTSQAEGALGRFGSTLGTAVSAGVAAAGAAVAAGVAVGVKAAGDLEQAVANISTIKPEIDTSAVFGALNEMTTRIPQSAAQLGDSLYNIFSSVDVSQEQAIALLETFSKGAVGAQTDAETFGTAIMGVLNAYGLAAEDAAHVSDVFFNTVNKGVVTGQELAASLGPVTQAAKTAGVSIDELGAMIAAVTKEGGPAAQNINNLNNFLQKITTKEAQTQLNALGVATKTATGEFRPTADVLTDLKARLAGMTDAARANALQAIFPDAQARQGALVLLSQLDLVKEATLENTTASGVAEEAYRKMSATFNSQSKLLVNSLMAILTTIGGQLLPHITPLVTAFAQALPGAFKSAQEAVSPFIASLAALGPLVAEIARQVGDAWRTVVQVFTEGWEPSETVDPFVNAVGMIATVLRDTVLPAVQEVADFIVEQFGVVVSWVQENWPLIQETIQTVLTAIQGFWQAHGESILNIVRVAWEAVKVVISTALQNTLDILKLMMQAINGDWEGAWTTLQGIAQRNLDALMALFQLFFGGTIEALTAWAGEQIAALTAWGEQTLATVTDTWTGVQATTETTMAAVGAAIEAGWTAAQTTTATVLAAIQAATETAWAAISAAIDTAWATISSTVSTQSAAVQSTISTTWNAVSSLTSSIWNALSEIVASALRRVVAAVEQMASQVLGALRSLQGSAGSAAAGIGAAIIDGIRGAIMSKAQSIADAAASAVRRALEAARRAIGAHSPSRLFADKVGLPMAQGIVQGFEQGQKLLDRSMAGVLAPTPSLALAGMSRGDLSGGIDYDRLGVAVARAVGQPHVVNFNGLTWPAAVDEMERRQYVHGLLRGGSY